MSHRLLRFGLALAMALVSGAAFAQKKVVHVYNWSDYIDPSILEDFTRETGIKVVYDVYDGNEVLETKLLAGNSGYDVVAPTSPFLARQIKAGAYQKLDKSKLPNLKNMWSEITKRLAQYDPGNQYVVNYMWGTTGIGYNVAKVKVALGDVPLDSWDMLFKPENAAKLKSCGINILDALDETFAIAMNSLGRNPDSKDTADLEAGGAVYSAIHPYVKTFNSSAYIDELANGDTCITIGWSGDILQAKRRAKEARNGVEVNYLIPKEGTYIWMDSFAIPADAKNVAEAHAFINYMMKPKVMAKASEFVQYANGNLASQAVMSEAVVKNPSIYPDAAMMKKLFTISPYGAREQRVLNRIWTQIKTGK